ncbi:MAG: DUF2817 domain-containing protein [Pseudomonadota bacterium]
MSTEDYFGSAYRDARRKFLGACSQNGVFTGAYLNEGVAGPDGESLVCDIAYIGEPSAENLLIVSSGCHGAEAGCGSGVMTGWISEGGAQRLPSNTAVLLLHTLNPWGFAYMARTTEENVDLNRNFIDFPNETPENQDYARLHSSFLPGDWTSNSIASIFRDMADYRQQYGEDAYLSAMRAGQYQFADGIGYGGARPSWSRNMFEHVVKLAGARRRRVAFVDIHTGVGDYAEPVFICFHPPGGAAYSRAAKWWGFKDSGRGAGRPEGRAAYNGTIFEAFPKLLPDVETTVTCLEFGTLPMEDVQLGIIADNWLRRTPAAGEAGLLSARKLVRDAFYPDDSEWRSKVFPQAVSILEQTIACLSKSGAAPARKAAV